MFDKRIKWERMRFNNTKNWIKIIIIAGLFIQMYFLILKFIEQIK